MNKEEKSGGSFALKPLCWGVAGLVVGALCMGVLVVCLLPRTMLVTRESVLGFEETIQALQRGIEREGWSSPGTIALNASLAKKGVRLDPAVTVVQLCKPEYAKEVLHSKRDVSCLMPCAISVWEADDGRVFVSKMNTGLLGKLFGGVVARVMGGNVAADEHRILQGIVQ